MGLRVEIWQARREEQNAVIRNADEVGDQTNPSSKQELLWVITVPSAVSSDAYSGICSKRSSESSGHGSPNWQP